MCPLSGNYKHSDITERIIAAGFKVHSALGPGFLEKVYENALMIELHKQGLKAQQQCRVSVKYDGQVVGEYFADVLVEDKVVIELKATEEVSAMNEIQCNNYLRATGIQVGLVLAFGARKLVICRVDCPE